VIESPTETPSETIDRVLSSYDLGEKLRRLRLRKKVALVDLGKHTGLSASMLSQLENGKLIPTLPTLARIAMVFDVGLDHFFEDRKAKRLFSVTRAEERMRFPERAGVPSPAFFFECLAFAANDKTMQAYLADFPVRSAKEIQVHFHEGAEFLYVISGEVAVLSGDDETILRAGDSCYFDASEPHGYRGAGEAGGKAVVVTVPPRI
jgi:transcriptional regulator with XRE-family HTH domain